MWHEWGRRGTCICYWKENQRERGHYENQEKQKQTPWPLVRERTIPTDRPPLVDEI
jgi:hypothetical protein